MGARKGHQIALIPNNLRKSLQHWTAVVQNCGSYDKFYFDALERAEKNGGCISNIEEEDVYTINREVASFLDSLLEETKPKSNKLQWSVGASITLHALQRLNVSQYEFCNNIDWPDGSEQSFNFSEIKRKVLEMKNLDNQILRRVQFFENVQIWSGENISDWRWEVLIDDELKEKNFTLKINEVRITIT